MNIGIYIQNEHGGWQRASSTDGAMFPETYITLQNGQVDFILPGYGKYKVSIDSGCFRSITAGVADVSLSPWFYLTAG